MENWKVAVAPKMASLANSWLREFDGCPGKQIELDAARRTLQGDAKAMFDLISFEQTDHAPCDGVIKEQIALVPGIEAYWDRYFLSE